MVIEASQDTSVSLKRKHYDSHKRALRYGGFLDSTSVQLQQEVGVVREVKAGSDSGGDESSQEVVVADALLLEACGGRTAHKCV